MKLRFFGSTPRERVKIVAVLATLFLLGFARYQAAPGDDLAVSYLGCRLLASGDTQDLYSYDPDLFSEVAPDDTAWQAQADRTGFKGYTHPYVQTPLWAWSLQPLCTRLRFPGFDRLFAALSIFSFVAVAWLVARFWAPDLLNPLALGVICLLFSRSEPFRYAMVLMQTHILYVLLTIVSLILAQRRRPVAAGALLALAAAVKITPAFFIVYWLLTRRYRAVISMVVCSAVLLLAAVFATSPSLFSTFLADLHRISGVLLVSENNQSFAAWRMGHFFPLDDLDELASHVLPRSISIGGNILLLLSVILGGLIDRRSYRMPGTDHRLLPTSAGSPTPLGAMFALVGITLFTPIAWTHYFIVLLPAAMLLLQEFYSAAEITSRRSQAWLLTLTIAICLLNFRPLAGDSVKQQVGLLGIVRIHFLSGVLCLLALALAAWNRYRLGVNEGKSIERQDSSLVQSA